MIDRAINNMPLFEFLYASKIEDFSHKTYEELYMYWNMWLLERINNLFEYKGLPDSVAQREIELRLNLDGQCFFMEYSNKLRVFHSSFSNVANIYIDDPLSVNLYSPIYSTNVPTSAGVLCRNCDYVLPTRTIVEYYADKLAHLDLTLTNVLVNMRAKNVPIAQNAKMFESVKTWLVNLWKGRNTAIEDKSFSMLDFKQMNAGASESLMDIVDARKSVIMEFYEQLGIRNARVKRTQMTDNEVEAGDAMLLLNISNMLKCRKDAVEQLNSKYGLNVSVDYCEEILNQFREEGGADYANKELEDVPTTA